MKGRYSGSIYRCQCYQEALCHLSFCMARGWTFECRVLKRTVLCTSFYSILGWWVCQWSCSILDGLGKSLGDDVTSYGQRLTLRLVVVRIRPEGVEPWHERIERKAKNKTKRTNAGEYGERRRNSTATSIRGVERTSSRTSLSSSRVGSCGNLYHYMLAHGYLSGRVSDTTTSNVEERSRVNEQISPSSRDWR